MDPSEKKKIQSNLTKLVNLTKLNDGLRNKLVETEIFSSAMVEDIKNCSDLYKKVPKRGCTAFSKLVIALAESGNCDAAMILDPENAARYITAGEPAEPPPDLNGNNANDDHASTANANGNITVKKLAENLSNVKVFNEPTYENAAVTRIPIEPPPIRNDSMEPIKVSVKQATEFLYNKPLGTYTMKSNPRGTALIVNFEKFSNITYKNRQGSRVDEQNLSDLFREFGFNVDVQRNLNQLETYTTFDSLSKNPDLEKAEMLIICILSHGHNGEIVCSDGRVLKTEQILKKFNNEYCPQLRGKPKFFIFQACRGEDIDYGTRKRTVTDGREEMDAAIIPPEEIQKSLPEYKDPVWEDFLIAYSTLPGYVSQRDIYRGTWFIESLVDVFMNYSHENELCDMLTLVARKLGGYESEDGFKQSFAFENRHFTKKLYFNPGLYESN